MLEQFTLKTTPCMEIKVINRPHPYSHINSMLLNYSMYDFSTGVGVDEKHGT